MFNEYSRLCQLAARYRTEAHGVPTGSERDELHRLADDCLEQARRHAPRSGPSSAPAEQCRLGDAPARRPEASTPRPPKNHYQRWGIKA